MNASRNEVTVGLSPAELATLDSICRRRGLTRDELVADLLRRQVACWTLEAVRERVTPFAAAAGFVMDEDVFREVL